MEDPQGNLAELAAVGVPHGHDVSRREFTGPTEAFEKLDADQNGLLNCGEATTVRH